MNTSQSFRLVAGRSDVLRAPLVRAFLAAALLAGAWPTRGADVAPAATAVSSTASAMRSVTARPDGLALAAGQAVTQLPDGRWLVSGGATGRSVASPQLLVFDPTNRRLAPLAAQLQIARSAHTATLLPDGTVLVLGGVDGSGAAVAQAEVFNPATRQGTVLSATGLLARSHHTANVLSDGRVLVAGGMDARGAPLPDAELYDPSVRQASRLGAREGAVRMDAQAALVGADGVLVSGGVDVQGRPVAVSEFFDPVAQVFKPLEPGVASALIQVLTAPTTAPMVTFSQPAAGGLDVGVDTRLAVRFSTRLDVASLNAATVTLIGPAGTTPIRAVPVERGVLLFITPAQQLLPSAQYTLFVKGAQDEAKRKLPLFSLGFQTQALQAAAQGDGAGSQSANADAGTSADASKVAARTPAELAGIDEDWIPEARHRKGEWMSHRAYLAQSTLPKANAQLREALRAYNPKVPDPEGAVVAQAVSAQTPRIARASWSELDAKWRAQRLEHAQANPVAAGGTTVLTGQVLRLNGLPLAHVTMSIGTVVTKTDENGEFVLAGVPAGNQVLTIDASTANRPGAVYGRYQYLYNLQAGKTNLLPFTIWMSKLDVKHAIHIDSPTRRDTVISNPLMPGLSIVLPAGTVVRDVDGKIVREVTLTPIPVDQPPYPMPYAGVPLHYTLQPGGALIQDENGKPKGAVVHYPNYTTFGAGSTMQLFDYDPNGRGWYVYSKATVGADGTEIHSDRDFLIYQFGTTSYSSGGPPNPNPPPPNCSSPPPDAPPSGGGGWGSGSDGGDSASACGGEPVDYRRGLFNHAERDLYVPDVLPIDIRREYSDDGQPRTYDLGSQGTRHGPLAAVVKSFGNDTTNPYESYLVFDASGTRIEMTMGDGSVVNFDNPDGAKNGSYPYDILVYRNLDDQGSYRAGMIQKDAPSSSFIVTFKDGRHWGYSAFSARLIWIEDRIGNRMTFARPNVNAYVSRVTSPNGHFVDFHYNATGLVDRVTDNLGRHFDYAYDPANPYNLQTATDPNSQPRKYEWDQDGFLWRITDPNGKVVVENHYETLTWDSEECGGNTILHFSFATGRVLSQKLADQSTFGYSYNGATLFQQCPVVSVQVFPSSSVKITDRRGTVRQVDMDGLGNVTTNTAALGLPEQQITTSHFDPATNLLSWRIDALSRKTSYQYDANGNVTQVTRLADTPNQVSVRASYDPVFNVPLTITDEMSRTTTLEYDANGMLASVKDPLTHTTTIGHDPQGHVASVTSALNKTTRFTYSGNDLASVIDPLNRQVKYLTDAVGRVMTTIDGLGNRTYTNWDPLNRLLKITDALGGQTSFTYDYNGNVLTQKDAKFNTTTYTYNDISRRATKQDALLNPLESTLYEPGGLVRQVTDRKGQVSGVTYDSLGRVHIVGFGATAANPTAYTSTATLTWDAGNRLTNIVDVQNGKSTTIGRSYDGLDRMMSETTEQGEVDYIYNPAGQRKTMTIKNGPAGSLVTAQSVTYNYDNAGRLSTISQAAAALNNNVAQLVTLMYDNANRLTKKVFSPGPTIKIGYTDADEVQTITYLKADGTTLASGSYVYDAAGRRTSVSGDLANFVQATGTDVTDAVYNVNNQLTTWSGKTFGYDKNGNLTSDGVSSYTWDERNQLKSISGGVTASFRYDASGRRLSKTISGTTTAFAYDFDNFVQELSAPGPHGNVNANLLTGGTDETFLRSASGPTATLSWLLPEANNSTVMTTDPSGANQRSYAYDPYGTTTGSGAADGNTQQYTGRENDGIPLYYYRNRYYMPGCMRFISEDPIGWASGQTNNYAYVGGNSVQFTDAYGLCVSQAVSDGIAGAAGGFVGGLVSSRGNLEVAAASGLIGGAMSYVTSGDGIRGGTAAGAAGGIGSAVRGGGGPAGVFGGMVGGALSGGLSASDAGVLPNTAGGAIGGAIGGFTSGLLTKSLGNNPLPITLGVMGLVGGAAGGLVQDMVSGALSGSVCH